MLSTERYQGEMQVVWNKKQRKKASITSNQPVARTKVTCGCTDRALLRDCLWLQEKDREARKKAAQQAAEARGERPVSAGNNRRPASAEPDTYKLRVQLPEHLGFPALSREFAFELRVTDVSTHAIGRRL